jgi:hypothetical protein
MKRIFAVGAMLVLSSLANAQPVNVSQRALVSLRKMCGAVLIQLHPVDMMYVQTYTLNEIINRTSGAIVGLDVVAIDPKDPTITHSCHYGFVDVSQAGEPNVNNMLVDLVPVTIEVNAEKAIGENPVNVKQ